MKIVGRSGEIELVETFVREAAARGGALVLSGEPGVGKSALLREGTALARAAGTRVLSGSGTEFESGLSYSTVGQVLLPALDSAPGLPPQQRLALEVALGWAEGTVPSQLLFRAAVTGLLRAASASQPLLIVVDDLQWADRASAEVLIFAARRLEGSRAGFLAATRDRGGLPAVEIQPLEACASAELLAARFPGLAPRVRERLLADARATRWRCSSCRYRSATRSARRAPRSPTCSRSPPGCCPRSRPG